MYFILIIVIILILFLCKNKEEHLKDITVFDSLKNITNRTKNRFIFNKNYNKLKNIDQIYCLTMPQRRKYIKNVLDIPTASLCP